MTTSFEVLNDILTGEHIAIEQYQAYIDSLPASPLRNHLLTILTDHKEHAQRLSYYIQINGGHVDEGSGFRGKLALWKTKMNEIWENQPVRMLERLYDGEEKGLTKAVQLSEKFSSTAEKELLEPIFADEQEHLRQLMRAKEDLLH